MKLFLTHKTYITAETLRGLGDGTFIVIYQFHLNNFFSFKFKNENWTKLKDQMNFIEIITCVFLLILFNGLIVCCTWA